MTSKIRKLYNVLVVGGAMAATTACTKAETTQPATAPVVTEPAAAAVPVPAPTPAPAPVVAEPVKPAPAIAAPPTPVTPPAKVVAKPRAKPKAAVKKAADRSISAEGEPGTGVSGWS